MRSFLLSVALLVLAATPALADMDVVGGTLSGGVHATTDYIHRGISRSDNAPSLGADVKYRLHNGLYAALGVQYTDFNVDGGANYELTPRLGFSNTVYDHLTYDLGLVYFGFPGADRSELDYWEFYAQGMYDFNLFKAGLEWNASPDYINGSGASIYYGAKGETEFGNGLKAVGHLGAQYVDDEGPYINSDYMEWGLGLRYNYEDMVDLMADYTDTDLDDNECVEKCGARITLGVGKRF